MDLVSLAPDLRAGTTRRNKPAAPGVNQQQHTPVPDLLVRARPRPRHSSPGSNWPSAPLPLFGAISRSNSFGIQFQLSTLMCQGALGQAEALGRQATITIEVLQALANQLRLVITQRLTQILHARYCSIDPCRCV